ncbi:MULTISPECIES: tripartite tricarboxylate transporter substrate binding protein BugE [unclassified Variovorax]|uniref:tripartite tricarboxylate transporter substrate binding protein BugE n=1 Tax=unclassified Variovorax TaxID=663243 RepID=UPI000F86A35B|nr:MULTISPECIES: tripartite tricarboxylate transporter substrate binding protein BugE [unclassified Variovorax]MCR8957694.1 tripartite tricarboxylate transporter substrate binding protein BugE [Variovorax sp. S12S4]RST46182.1 tripartite tricarboxylate transporter substrate binding protein BugE [Variovorax sp. DXTD-1]
MQRRHLLSALAAVSVAPGISFAQQGKPIRMIVPFPPGGATDITARVLSEPLAKILQQPVVIDNRAGAGGSIGMAEVARSAPDGLAFGVATLSTHGVNPAVYQKLPYDPIKGFVAVTELVKAPGVVVINPQVLPVKSFAELVKYLKANPGKVSYASPGNGTIGHMWGELFKSSTGTSMVHIPYRGAGPAINDVLAGEVPVYFDQVASSLPHVKAGKLKALAVSWSSRLDVLPEVPTYRELGYPANNDPSWFGLVAPAGTPADVALRMQQAVATALKDASVRERLALQGLYASGTTPAEFAKQIDSEIEKMKKVAAFARIRLD